jgi:hypothetical protein
MTKFKSKTQDGVYSFTPTSSNIFRCEQQESERDEQNKEKFNFTAVHPEKGLIF